MDTQNPFSFVIHNLLHQPETTGMTHECLSLKQKLDGNNVTVKVLSAVTYLKDFCFSYPWYFTGRFIPYIHAVNFLRDQRWMTPLAARGSETLQGHCDWWAHKLWEDRPCDLWVTGLSVTLFHTLMICQWKCITHRTVRTVTVSLKYLSWLTVKSKKLLVTYSVLDLCSVTTQHSHVYPPDCSAELLCQNIHEHANLFTWQDTKKPSWMLLYTDTE